MNLESDIYLYPGGLYAEPGEHIVKTVLGSCISVCLWDSVLFHGGINHYMLPLWNGEGLKSPKYGNIAITKLIEKMINMGSKRHDLKAKVFGGGSVIKSIPESSSMNVGVRNISVAIEVLGKEKISVVSSDVGGRSGRRLIFNTKTGDVYIKKLSEIVRDKL